MLTTISTINALFSSPLSKALEEEKIQSVILAQTGIIAKVKLSEKGIKLSLDSKKSATSIMFLLGKGFRSIAFCSSNKFDVLAIPV